MASSLSGRHGVRHHWPDRLFHWLMAVTVFILMFSAFLPIVGIQFDWVPWHWISGAVLTVLVVLHILRAVLFQGIGAMLPRRHDFQRAVAPTPDSADSAAVAETVAETAVETSSAAASARIGAAGSELQRAGSSDTKYDIFQKAYHWGVALVVLALIVSGLPMLLKLDTVFWDRNPSMLSDANWGYIYVLHGIAALVLIFMLLLHIYFAFLPEHRQLLKSMINGTGPLSSRHE